MERIKSFFKYINAYFMVYFKNIFLILLFTFVIFNTGAEDTLEPQDPDIVIPSVIMEIEDLSIDLIIAELPEDEWALPIERDVPLPEEILQVKEPTIDFNLLEQEHGEDESAPSLFVESVLGGGNVNHLLSQIQINKIGELPRYSLFFNHETLDGFSFKESGTGFSFREELLKASIKYKISNLQIENTLNYLELEHGLQGLGDYYSKISRTFSSINNFILNPTGNFHFNGSIFADYSTFLLTGSASPNYNVDYPPAEIIAGTGIGLDFQKSKVLFGFNAQYKFRNIFGNEDMLLHRILAGASISIELPHWLNIGAEASYFYSKQLPVLIPFEASFWGTPLDYFSFKIRGGYFIKYIDLNTILSEYIYSDMPFEFQDNHGFFTALQVQFNLQNQFTISLKQELLFHNNMPQLDDTLNSTTGLFPVVFKDDVVELDTEVKLSWQAPKVLSLTFINKNIMLWEPDLSASGEFSLETALAQKQDRYGMIITAGVITDFIDLPLRPILDFNAYVQIADFARIICEFNDILNPVFDEYRFSREPFITPGFLGTLKIQIKF